MPYCMPEQPPDSINRRKDLPCFSGSPARIVLICSAALAVTLTAEEISALQAPYLPHAVVGFD